VEKDVPPRLNALPFRGKSVNSSARINVNMLADALLNGKAGGYPTDYKFLWLSNNNYLNQLADINKAIDAFQKPDFILVTEQFMTSTAKFADIVLPVCTFLERNDFYAGFSAGSFNMESGVFAVQNKAIEPLGESKSQLEICEALASKLGIVDYNDKSDESWVRQIVGKFTEELASPDYETLKEQGMFKMGSHEAAPSSQKEADGSEQNPFPTPSGRIEIYSQLIAEMKYPLIPPVPKYIETWESVNDPLAEKYPLQLITPHFQLRAHSQFANLPWLKDLRHQAVAISTIDAGARGIRDGDMVMIFNDRGKVVIPAEVTERMMPGVVAVPQGAWYQPDENGVDHGGCANVLTKNVTSPAGAFPSHTALVQVVKVER
jgi:anaerobic dimethyl sulfoxide reductase subunit A